MRELPILFSTPMVLAILEGRKTQTRRLVKLPHMNPLGEWKASEAGGTGVTDSRGEVVMPFPVLWHTRTGDTLMPRQALGDVLYVRETWGVADAWVYECATDPPRSIAYRADLSARSFDPPHELNTHDWGWLRMRWRPSIHMPKWAARLKLSVARVRVERVQEITRDDEIAEGCPAGTFFDSLWDSINAKRAPWASNPWVWVIEFERVANG